MGRTVTVLAAAGIVAACFWGGLATIVGADATPPDAAPPPADARVGPPAAPSAGLPEREAAEPHPAPRGDGPEAVPPDFDAVVDQLVEIGVAMWHAVQDGDAEAVQARNAEGEASLAELRAGCRHAGALALDRLTRLPAPQASTEAEVRRHVLERVLRDALAERHAASEQLAERGPLDELLDAVLATLPVDELIAHRVGIGLLVGQPWLGPGQETAVLELAELVPETPFLEPVVAGLLRTLWQNLEATGARTSGRLASLAMLFLDDANPARRRAAAQQLLRDDRYRDFTVAHVVRSADRTLAAEIAQVAAAELPVREALGVLEAVQDVGDADPVAAWLVLGSRDGGLLATEYEQVLADGVRPHLRASLVTGATARIDARSLELAAVAFRHDPDPEVRLRALYALAMHPDPEVAEQALADALDDPVASRDPGWVASVALALRNLAVNGALHALDRLGRRIEQHPLLGEFDRRALRTLLAEHLPGRR